MGDNPNPDNGDANRPGRSSEDLPEKLDCDENSEDDLAIGEREYSVRKSPAMLIYFTALWLGLTTFFLTTDSPDLVQVVVKYAVEWFVEFADFARNFAKF
ncbi:hypothetical protein GE061_010906 [Apolygus lucorum]|uniref:Transmembrane protein n=1 Tax=Apolygus lucorum TaxID=248454 RepID=A0A6A4K9H1_APOLU|nr:hypothetical protein GE061_010906 [Apolygus lucorum]